MSADPPETFVGAIEMGAVAARTAVDTDDEDDFGSWMRERRQELGMSLRECAAAAGVSLPTLAAIELGRRRPNERQIAAIEKALADH